MAQIGLGQLGQFIQELENSEIPERTIQTMIDHHRKLVLWDMLKELSVLAQKFAEEVQDGVGAVHLRCALFSIFNGNGIFLRQTEHLLNFSEALKDPEKALTAALVYAQTTGEGWARKRTREAAEAHHEIADRVFALSQVAEAFLDQDSADLAREYAGGVPENAVRAYKVPHALHRLQLLDLQFEKLTGGPLTAWKLQEMERANGSAEGAYWVFDVLLAVARCTDDPGDFEILRTHLRDMDLSQNNGGQERSFLAQIAELTGARPDINAARKALSNEDGRPMRGHESRTLWMRIASVTREPRDFYGGLGSFLGMKDLRWLNNTNRSINQDREIESFSRFLALLNKTVQEEFALEPA